jgi:uncharacterized protein (TIGR02453 family)
MIEKTTLDFLKKLKKNNKKEWFDKNRSSYDVAKENIETYIQDVLVKMAKFEPAVSSLVARKCMFRINRDIRFSNDKSPYKTNFGASINPGGKMSGSPGYYIHLEPGHSFLAGGIYMPEAPILAAVRQEIDYDLKGFNAILNNKNFKKTFGGLSAEGSLVRPPKGYEESNPAIVHLKNKHFIVVQNLPDTVVLSKNLLKTTISTFETMAPFIGFLKRAKG